LEEEVREMRDATEIRSHVKSYYKKLFGAEPEGEVALGDRFWLEKGRLLDEESLELVKPFTIKELEEAFKDMDMNASPGPDGLPVGFYRVFWHEVKFMVLEMFQNLYRGELNLSRLNYGMISLIPKTKDATNIK
jgi:hypothetical protein